MKDMESVQTETYEFNNLMNYKIGSISPLWARRPQQIYLAERIPIIEAANQIIDELTERLMILLGDKTKPEFKEIIFHESMGKFRISRHTFGMTDEKAMVRDLSRLTKPLINYTKLYIFGPNQNPLVVFESK